MDKIFIEDLCVETFIGIYDWEQKTKQPLYIDCEIGFDLSKAGQTDKVTDSIDYAKVATTIKQTICKAPAGLLETLAERIATALFENFPTERVKLRINKGAIIENCKNVGIEIERIKKIR